MNIAQTIAGLFSGAPLLRFATPYNKIASSSLSAATGEKRIAGRLFRPIGSSNKKSLRVVANNFYLSGTNGVTNPSSVLNFAGLFIEYNNQVKQVTWGGNPTPSFAGGAINRVSDPIYPSDLGALRFTRNQTMYVRYEMYVANGGVIPITEGRESASLAYQYDTSANSLTNLATTGSLVFANGNPGSSFEPPLQIIGEDESAGDSRAWLFVGDSIIAQGGDNSYWHTACTNATAYIAGCSFAKVGAIIQQSINNFSYLSPFVKYANGAVIEYDTNSMDGDTVTGMQSNNVSLASSIRGAALVHPKARSLVLGRSMILNRTTDATGATVRTNWNAGEKAEQMNDWYATQVGSTFDFFTSNLMDSPNLMRLGAGTKGVTDSNYYKWPSTYTQDGTHPNPTSASGTTGLGANARAYLLANA